MTPLLIATTNRSKLREMEQLLDGLPLVLSSLSAFPAMTEPEEHGATFAENARDKARHYARQTRLLTVAEDSGLEIDALDGAPGVQSARFPGATYPEKFARLFQMMDERGAQESAARFVCALALARGDDVIFETTGVVEGMITRAPRGAGGFGYDPIFVYPPIGKTLAEVTPSEKAAVSHRGRAVRALRDFLERRAFQF
jgi:XTP/dITP diphosphohydrolase